MSPAGELHDKPDGRRSATHFNIFPTQFGLW